MDKFGTIVLLDDEREILWSLEKFLKKKGYQTRSFDDGNEVLKYLHGAHPGDIVVSDIRMPAMDGLDFLTKLRKLHMAPPVIMMTAYGSIKNAVEAMKAGAYDYLTKPFELDELLLVIQRAMEVVSLRREVQRLRADMERRFSINGLAAKSKLMQSVLVTVSRMAKEKSPVLFVGESGTGKQFLSQVIHRSGDRAQAPFEMIVCSAMPEGLQRLQLFGDEKNEGLLQKAQNGILFMDDIDALSQECQLLLLQYLETGEYQFHGNGRSIKPDARIIAALLGSIDDAGVKEALHPDLFFKLSPFIVQLPQLLHRREDIPLLAESFLQTFCNENDVPVKRISNDAMKVLLNYAWPGNVRELQNVIERAVILATGNEIRVEELPPQMTQLSQIGSAQFPTNYTLEELEKAYIYQVLQENNNHQGKSAKILGIDRKTLWRKVKNYYQEPESK